MNLRNIVYYCANETHRQHASAQEVAGMFDAWEMMLEVNELNHGVLWRLNGFIKGYAAIKYRVTPVTFSNGKSGIPHDQIENAMTHLLKNYGRELPTDGFVKEFLEIHPFQDGNGRVASLLYNWRNGTLLDPVPLPYFDWDE